jgi:hypothetical protein
MRAGDAGRIAARLSMLFPHWQITWEVTARQYHARLIVRGQVITELRDTDPRALATRMRATQGAAGEELARTETGT